MRRPADELVKAAEFTVLGMILVQEREIGLVEFLEEFVPIDLIQPFVFRAEIDPQDSCVSILFGRLCGGRSTLPLDSPSANDVVVRDRMTFAHRFAPRVSLGSTSFPGERHATYFVLIADSVPSPSQASSSLKLLLLSGFFFSQASSSSSSSS
jgi:hypothetical protein